MKNNILAALFLVTLLSPLSAFATGEACISTCLDPADYCSAQGKCERLSSASPPAASSKAADSGNSFVPISDIPAIVKLGNTPNLPAFLNQLYLICIGIAVVLAVLQLVRAGVMYSVGDSGFAKTEEAKHLILVSLLGLLLVLSPVIVFSIINPKILQLNISTGDIKTGSPAPNNGAPPADPSAGQAGLHDTPNAKALYDGQYMDLVRYSGGTAQTDVTNYHCQNASQGNPHVFSNGKTGDAGMWYAACLTPKISYVEAQNNYIDSDNQAKRDTYGGECNAITDAQEKEGFGAVILAENIGVGDDKLKTDCTASIIQNDTLLGQAPTCYSAYSTCQEKK